MPKFKDVPTLKNLALKSIGSLVAEMMPYIVAKVQKYREPQKIMAILEKITNRLNDIIVSHVPYNLYDLMAVEVLNSVKVLIDITKKGYPQVSMPKFFTEMNVAVSLTEVVLNSRLKSIDFSVWPKIMRYVLYRSLVKMTGLENLNLGSCTIAWKSSEIDKNILDGIKNMKNLQSICLCFDCSDLIIQTISESCPYIQSIDVTSSRSVTDRSIPYLLNCKNLKVLQLHGTSILSPGLAKLISGLPKLEDIGRWDDFPNIIRFIKENETRTGPFALKKIHTRDICTEHLKNIVQMFPKAEYVAIFHDNEIADITVLAPLDNLKQLKLLPCALHHNYLNQFLEIRGSNLTTLHLEHAENLDINFLIHLGRYGSQLKSLVLYNCDFTFTDRSHAVVKPGSLFRCLERLFWVVDAATAQLEFILMHGLNMKYVHLGSSTGITHSSIVKILKVNPMKHLEELRVLYSGDMNMRTVELLLASCTQLRVLSELESWQGITSDELRDFKNTISRSNFDLDIRPTLSFSR